MRCNMKPDRIDPSFAAEALYGSEYWCAQALGRSDTWFRKARPTLEKDGFPAKDKLIGMTQKADVYAWIARRRKIADAERTAQRGQHHISKENPHAF